MEFENSQGLRDFMEQIDRQNELFLASMGIKDRHDMIDAIVSNLIQSRDLYLREVPRFMVYLTTVSDEKLAQGLGTSRVALKSYLSNCWILN